MSNKLKFPRLLHKPDNCYFWETVAYGTMIKKLRFIGMTITMVVLCAGFSACGGDDDDNGSGSSKTGAPKGVEAVDLGLTVKWASCNIGASKPWEYGNYYAWGETEPKTTYEKETYQFWNNGEYINIGNEISNTKYDVAHVKWGGKWRMPTAGELMDLITNCTWENVTMNGINGYRVTGRNGNSIFLPACDIGYEGRTGSYRSSTRDPDLSYEYYSAYDLFFDISYGKRHISTDKKVCDYDGEVVRPVME